MDNFEVINPIKISYIDAKIGYKGPFEFSFSVPSDS